MLVGTAGIAAWVGTVGDSRRHLNCGNLSNVICSIGRRSMIYRAVYIKSWWRRVILSNVLSHLPLKIDSHPASFLFDLNTLSYIVHWLTPRLFNYCLSLTTLDHCQLHLDPNLTLKLLQSTHQASKSSREQWAHSWSLKTPLLISPFMQTSMLSPW